MTAKCVATEIELKENQGHQQLSESNLGRDVQGRALELLKTLKKVKGQPRVQALKELRQIVSAHDSAKKTLAENNGFCLISSLLGCFTTHAVGSEAIGILVNFDLDSKSITNLMQPAKMEPNLRPPTSDLLQYQETYHVLRASVMENSGKMMATPEMELRNSKYPVIRTTYTRLKDVHNSVRYSTIYSEKFPGSVPHWGSGNCDDDMCQIDDEDDLVMEHQQSLILLYFMMILISVGCMVIEMATGKAPWSQQYQEVAALFHIGTTKSHPPIHEHLSAVAIDFFVKMKPNLRSVASDLLQENSEKKMATPEMKLKNSTTYTRLKDVQSSIDDEDDLVIRASAKFDFALLSDDFNKPTDIWILGDFFVKMSAKEPNLRPAASDLLRHPLVTREYQDAYPVLHASVMDVHNSVRCSTIYPEKFPRSVPHWESENCDDDLCQIDDEDDFLIGASAKFYSALLSDDFNKVLDVRLLRWLQESLLGASSIRRYVPALFHIGITKSHPFIPKQLSVEAIDILLKCLQKEPNLRHAAPDLFIHLLLGSIRKPILCYALQLWTTYTQLKDAHNSVRCSTIYPEKFPRSVPHWGSDNCDDDMCQIDDEDDFLIGASTKFYSALLSDDFNKPADIWSVGCTVIEMATGKPSLSQQYQEIYCCMATRKPSLSQQYQEVPPHFDIGTNKSHPSIPEHLSAEAVDILLKCLQKEPNLRPAASDLLETTCARLKDVHNSVMCSTIYLEKFPGSVPQYGSYNCDDDMCEIDDEVVFVIGA
ncbi:unnamed protein product [Camellia sinensis]